MPGLAEEAQFWADKAADAHHSVLEDVRSSAGKWQAAIAGFLGLYATAGFVLGPDKLASLPVQGTVRTALLAAVYGVAGACGIGAVVLANLAAQGIPEILTGQPVTGPKMRQLSYDRAVTANRRLSWAIRLAAVAGALLIAVSVFLVIAGIQGSNHPQAMVVTKNGAYCGELVNTGGKLRLRLPDGELIPLAGGSVTPVSSCPP